MTLRHGTLAILLLALSMPPGLAAQAKVDGEDTSWCTSSIPAECAVETYGPEAPVFSRNEEAEKLIDSRTVTSGSTCQKIVGAAFADFKIEGEAQEETPDGNAIVPHDGAHITGDGYDVVFIATSLGSGEDMLVTILHEAAHHADYESHSAAELAARLCLQDEEDDDEPTGNPVTPPEPVCTEKLVKETYIEYELEETVVGDVCFPWSAVGADFCTNDLVHKEWVPVEKVRWVTKTVCEN